MSDILETSINLAPELEKQSTISPETLESVHMKDKLLYIYTSGTTGLPKAAIITNLRYTKMRQQFITSYIIYYLLIINFP